MKLKARIVPVLPILIVLALAALAYMHAPSSRPESHAASIVSECRESQDHARCYESLVPLLYPKMSVPQLFEIIRSIRSSDPTYQFCHVLAHKIGERVVADDLEHWIDAIPLNPASGYCSNGFIHGVVGGRFRSEVLDTKTIETHMSDFRRACESRDGWSPSDLDRAICYHGMGHLYDFITDADLNLALDLCERTTTAQFQRVCIEGVFMQIFQPLEPDDLALIEQMTMKPTPNSYRRFCDSFKDDDYVGACLREAWPMVPGVLDGSGTAQLCEGQPNSELVDSCYQTAFSIVGRIKQGQPEEQAHACDRAPEARRNTCYSVVANAIVEEDRTNAPGAVSFCSRAPKPRECLEDLAKTARFNFGSNAGQYKRFCGALPKDMEAQCRSADARSYP